MSFLAGVMGGKILADSAEAKSDVGHANARAITAESQLAAADAQLAQERRSAERNHELNMEMANIFARRREEAEALQAKAESLTKSLLDAAAVPARIAADDVGLRALIREQLAAIRNVTPNHPLLERKARDRIYGEASGESREAVPQQEFSSEIANRAGLLAIIDQLAAEIEILAPEHAINDANERHYTYWLARELEFEKLYRGLSVDRVQEKFGSEHHKNSIFADPRYAKTASPEARQRAADALLPEPRKNDVWGKNFK